MSEPCRIEARGRDALRRVFDALRERDCSPEWTHDGRGIVATCPSCRGDRALLVELPDANRKVNA